MAFCLKQISRECSSRVCIFKGRYRNTELWVIQITANTINIPLFSFCELNGLIQLLSAYHTQTSQTCSTLVIRAKPAVFHFSLADSIYQQNLAKNRICNLSHIITGLPRRKEGGLSGDGSTNIRLYCHCEPVAPWQTGV